MASYNPYTAGAGMRFGVPVSEYDAVNFGITAERTKLAIDPFAPLRYQQFIAEFGETTDTFRIRYHPSRNFDKLFDGDGMQPIDKDCIAQFIGWMGELTQTNPMFNWRFYDSVPAS